MAIKFLNDVDLNMRDAIKPNHCINFFKFGFYQVLLKCNQL